MSPGGGLQVASTALAVGPSLLPHIPQTLACPAILFYAVGRVPCQCPMMLSVLVPMVGYAAAEAGDVGAVR